MAAVAVALVIVLLICFVRSQELRLVKSFLREQKMPQADTKQATRFYSQVLRMRRAGEFSHLGREVYLDHTGAGMYAQRQLKHIARQLAGNFYCNTHSSSGCSRTTHQMVCATRARLLQHFNVDDTLYQVVFTKSATHAIHVLSDLLPISETSRLFYATHSHNSIIGLRGKYGGRFVVLAADAYQTQLQVARQRLDAAVIAQNIERYKPTDEYDLVALPAKDNFVGIEYSMDVIDHLVQGGDLQPLVAEEIIHNENHKLVLLDAAAYLQGRKLDLGLHSPHFVVASLYKVMGIPTSVGCLLIRNDVHHILQKKYFGGGSTVAVEPHTSYVGYKQTVEKYEDGTVDYLGLSGVNYGLDYIDGLGLQNIHRHTLMLAQYLYKRLSVLRHANGNRATHIYNRYDELTNIVTYNLLDKDGGYISYHQILEDMRENGINIRASSQCNPGASQHYIGLEDGQFEKHYAENCQHGVDIDPQTQMPLGAIRTSMGYYNTISDLERLLRVIRQYVQ